MEQVLSDYMLYSRYLQYSNELGRKENYKEAVKRIMDMSRTKYADIMTPELSQLIDEAQEGYEQMLILGSQRSLQFGGSDILRNNVKIFNCATRYIDSPRVFGEIMWVLLCGCGVGFSVQSHHINQLPPVVKKVESPDCYIHVIEDSIEGWGDAIKALMDNNFNDPNSYVVFDFSKIRPQGSLIAGKFKAPGSAGLRDTIRKIRQICIKAEGRQLKSIEVYDIIMHICSAVLSGGVRRSATICMFDEDDQDMLTAKTGSWWVDHPQRTCSNNSAVLIRGESTRETFDNLFASTRQCGEPGIVWAANRDVVFNPCCEIGMVPRYEHPDGTIESGWQFCNLTEINGARCVDAETFYRACRLSAIIGTLQAGYTDMPYLGKASELITQKEALLGCSITGIQDNPEILLNPEIQRKGAEIVKETNELVAKLLHINPAARCTTVKPAGSTSLLLGTASGIHPRHDIRYIRHVQVNKDETIGQYIKMFNPAMVEHSITSVNGTDDCISFCVEASPKAACRKDVSAISLLENVKTTQLNWIEAGTRPELCTESYLRHNVSNTITVRPNEWDDVQDYIFENQDCLCGISLLPMTGEYDYMQAPFFSVMTPSKYKKTYDKGLRGHVEDYWNSLPELERGDYIWKRQIEVEAKCNQLNEDGSFTYDSSPVASLLSEMGIECIPHVARGLNAPIEAKEDVQGWVTVMQCLKDFAMIKKWEKITSEYVEMDFGMMPSEQDFADASSFVATACAGGKCEV